MKEFDQIKDMVYDELDELSRRGQLSKEAICIIGDLVDILKDIGTVEMFEEGIQVPEDDYSLASGYVKNGGYPQRKYYYEGNSYGGYGSDHISSGYGRRGSRGGYSRENSKEHMIQQLHNLMNEAQDEKDRQSIHHLIEQMQND